MPALSSAEDVLATELKEIYSAERQLSRFIPRIAKKVTSERLREMLEQRRERGASLIEQLDETFSELEVGKGRLKNLAAEGLLEDINEHLNEIDNDKLLDPVLLAAVQKLEHYCIAAWGAAASMGRLLEARSVVQTMEKVLEEGKRFDQEMTELAESEINPQILAGEEDEEEAQEEEGESASSHRSSSRSSRGKSSRRSH